VQARVNGEGLLVVVEIEEVRGVELHGAGYVQDVHCAATEARSFGAEAAEGIQQTATVDIGKRVETTAAAVLEQDNLRIGLGGGDVFPECFQAKCVDELGLLDFPNGEGAVLGDDTGLHGFGARLSDVEFEQGAGVVVEHEVTSDRRGRRRRKA